MPRASGTSFTQPSTSKGTSRNKRPEPNPSRLSSSQPVGKAPDQQDAHLAAELDQMVVKLVKSILILSVNKHPIKKPDLVKNALAGNGRIFSKVIEQAKKELSEVYGYKLIETERNKSFILISNIAPGPIIILREDYRQQYTLLYLILSYIFMKNGDIPEQGMWDYLAKLRISNEVEHPYFGDVRKLVTETFVKQAYLSRIKKTFEGMNDDRFYYGWGVRAEHEVSKKHILESICKLMGKPSTCFSHRHAEVYGFEEHDDDALEKTEN